MTKPMARDPIYRGRIFDAEIIELCVRWYIAYRLSYRDPVAMMAERGLHVSHTTMGHSVRARVRGAVEPLCTSHRVLLAGRRNLPLYSREMALLVSCSG